MNVRTADWLQDKSNLLIMELETFYNLTKIHWAQGAQGFG